MISCRHSRGFTLVELSIVLVIIALILGGITIGGGKVIESMKVNTLLSAIQDVAVAAKDFKNKYGYFPGDLPNASALLTANGVVLPACSYGGGGSVGNGLVDSQTERDCVVEHLLRARLISKADSLSSGYVAVTHPFGGVVTLGATPLKEVAVRITSVPCGIALQLDTKLDNSASNPFSTGTVTAYDSSDASIATCVIGGANDPVTYMLIRY